MLYQAGASGKGRAFAAGHAECVFVAGPSKQVVAPAVADIRARAAEAGRFASDILVFSLMTVIVAATDADAQAREAEYRRYVSHEGALTLMSGWTGIDFSGYGLDEPIRHIRNDAIHSAVDALTTADPDRVWTIRTLAEHAAIGGMGVTVVGSAATVADEMEAWIRETGVDGFNLAYAVTPETFEDVVTYLIPELQRRGLYKTEYAPGTWRQKLFGAGDTLSRTHPADQYRVRDKALAA